MPLHHLHKPLAQWVCAAAVRSARHLRKSVQKRERVARVGFRGGAGGLRWCSVVDLYQLALAVGEKDGARLALWAMGQLGPSRAKVDVKLVLDCEAHVEEEQQVVSIVVLLC